MCDAVTLVLNVQPFDGRHRKLRRARLKYLHSSRGAGEVPPLVEPFCVKGRTGLPVGHQLQTGISMLDSRSSRHAPKHRLRALVLEQQRLGEAQKRVMYIVRWNANRDAVYVSRCTHKMQTPSGQALFPKYAQSLHEMELNLSQPSIL